MSATNPKRRRHRLGPSPSVTGWSPSSSASTRGEDDSDLEREVEMLQRALEDQGEMPRKELGEVVACKYWGPGRYRSALSEAVDRGAIRKVARGRYGPASSS